MNVYFRARRKSSRPFYLVAVCVPTFSKKTETGREQQRPAFILRCVTELVRSHKLLIGKNSFEAASFILIVQHHYGNHAQVLFAGMALRDFALQVLQETIREMIQRTLAPGVLFVPRAAVRTDEFHRVLLRIAVQSSPAGAAHAYGFWIVPVHRGFPPEIHVHMK